MAVIRISDTFDQPVMYCQSIVILRLRHAVTVSHVEITTILFHNCNALQMATVCVIDKSKQVFKLGHVNNQFISTTIAIQLRNKRVYVNNNINILTMITLSKHFCL